MCAKKSKRRCTAYTRNGKKCTNRIKECIVKNQECLGLCGVHFIKTPLPDKVLNVLENLADSIGRDPFSIVMEMLVDPLWSQNRDKSDPLDLISLFYYSPIKVKGDDEYGNIQKFRDIVINRITKRSSIRGALIGGPLYMRSFHIIMGGV